MILQRRRPVSDLSRLIEQRRHSAVKAAAPSAPLLESIPVKKVAKVVAMTVGVVVLLVISLSLFSGGDAGPDVPPLGNVADICEHASDKYSQNLAHVFARLSTEVREGKIKSRKQLADAAREYTQAARNNAFAAVDEMDNESLPKTDFVGVDKEGNEFNFTDDAADYLMQKSVGHRRASE